MIETYVTNNYFKTRLYELENYLTEGDEVPGEVFINFINELNVSTLLVPGIVHDEDLDFEVLTSEDEEVKVLALFTDKYEFYNYYPSDSEYDPVSNDIEFYVDLIRENDLDGIIFNPGSSDFLLERDILLELPLNNGIEVEDDFEGYDIDELYNISRKASNDELVDFINNENDSFEELMLALSQSTLLNVIVSEKDLSKSNDNIIPLKDIDDFSLCTAGDDDSQFGMLFTSVDAIRDGMDDDGINYYYQITLLDDFMEFILLNDMDGIIINMGSDDYMISRDYLLEAYNGLTYNNLSFKNASDYAFIL